MISNCSFKIKKGENVALLGLNGAGKSTLLKLLLGLLKPTHGQILINGIDLVKIDLNIYWSLLTYIEQETNLISISVYDFLRADNQNFNEEKALLAIEKVGLLDKINSYPNKIHTLMTNVLTKDGVEFSGGQLQKMLIARSLCREKSCLYLFDEPTSALDNNSEINTYNQLKDLGFNKIGLFISHRLKTTQFCQRVMILKNVNFKIKQNQKVALLGPNGSGKTTLIKLLLRLYDLNDGEILINHQNIKNNLFNNNGVVFQDPKIFPITLKENLISDTINVIDFNQIINKVGFDQIMLSKKIDYADLCNSEVYDDGIEFSGGEKQLLALCRAMIRNADLVILDEPSSALDPIMKNKLLKLFNQLFFDKTVILITHDPLLANKCDRKILLNDGICCFE